MTASYTWGLHAPELARDRNGVASLHHTLEVELPGGPGPQYVQLWLSGPGEDIRLHHDPERAGWVVERALDADLACPDGWVEAAFVGGLRSTPRTFGHAIEALRAGRRVQRPGGPEVERSPEGLRAGDAPWLPTAEDLFAEDWSLVDDPGEEFVVPPETL